MHKSVLLKETIEGLAPRPGGKYIDGTVGGGGHAEALLDASSPDSRLLGLDRDPEAVGRCKARLARFGERFTCMHSDFASMRAVAVEHGFENVDGIVMDLGVSSFQLDEAGRGFSFMADGPLDMRMDQSDGESATELLARLDKEEMRELFKRLGEEPQARRIASAIIRERGSGAIETTTRLAETVSRAVGGRRGSRHPATRVFQALRMAVNREMEELEQALEDGLDLLRPGGRMAVITFESLSDRLVKSFFAEHVGRRVSLAQGGERWEGQLPAAVKVTRKAVRAGVEEIRDNPRARSAKLRAVGRSGSQG